MAVVEGRMPPGLTPGVVFADAGGWLGYAGVAVPDNSTGEENCIR